MGWDQHTDHQPQHHHLHHSNMILYPTPPSTTPSTTASAIARPPSPEHHHQHHQPYAHPHPHQQQHPLHRQQQQSASSPALTATSARGTTATTNIPFSSKAFVCPFCLEFGISDGASRISDLRRHFRTKHLTNAQWHCRAPATSPSHHHAHFATSSPVQGNGSGGGCGASFDWQSAYEGHVKKAHGSSSSGTTTAFLGGDGMGGMGMPGTPGFAPPGSMLAPAHQNSHVSLLSLSTAMSTTARNRGSMGAIGGGAGVGGGALSTAEAMEKCPLQVVWACGFESCRKVFEARLEHPRDEDMMDPSSSAAAATIADGDVDMNTATPTSGGGNKVDKREGDIITRTAKAYFSHVSNHFQDGKVSEEWDYSRRIRNLLHQSAVRDTWKALKPRYQPPPPPHQQQQHHRHCQTLSGSDEGQYRLRWEPQTTTVLRKRLETGDVEDARGIVELALALGSLHFTTATGAGGASSGSPTATVSAHPPDSPVCTTPGGGVVPTSMALEGIMHHQQHPQHLPHPHHQQQHASSTSASWVGRYSSPTSILSPPTTTRRAIPSPPPPPPIHPAPGSPPLSHNSAPLHSHIGMEIESPGAMAASGYGGRSPAHQNTQHTGWPLYHQFPPAGGMDAAAAMLGGIMVMDMHMDIIRGGVGKGGWAEDGKVGG